MSLEDQEPKGVSSTLAALAREDLLLLGIDELKERITLLNQEIARSEGQITSKQGSLSDAEAVFGKR